MKNQIKIPRKKIVKMEVVINPFTQDIKVIKGDESQDKKNGNCIRLKMTEIDEITYGRA